MDMQEPGDQTHQWAATKVLYSTVYSLVAWPGPAFLAWPGPAFVLCISAWHKDSFVQDILF